jgi:EAL domain-containing protein (putative c-di-GMP-specific phosphodiesterase class I)
MSFHSPAAHGRVLVVDDSSWVLRAHARTLSRAGFDVIVLGSDAGAQQLVQDRTVDLVITEVTTKTVAGKIIQAIRKADAEIPLIVMTWDSRGVLNEHATQYLSKLTDPTALVNEVQQAISRRRIEQTMMSDVITDPERKRFTAALGSLWIAYQPILHRPTGRIYGNEALVRSLEPGLENPAALFAAAERHDALFEIGRAIRGKIAEDIAGSSRLVTFVNVHPRELYDLELFDSASSLSRVAGNVVLEITERCALDEIEDLQSRVEALRALGYRIALDDLGAGYAGLRSLAQLKPDVVKVDMSLIRNVDKDPTRRAILDAVWNLCRKLGMTTIAEGIETEGERAALTEIGFELMQGFLLGKPRSLASSIAA